MEDRPNILFITVDQLSWDALSSAGNSYVQTPHMDRIRSSGVSFNRAYCTNPVCAPARSSWATGLYTAETGIPFNGGLLHEDIPDIGGWLTSRGYQAYHAGKWHVEGRDVRAGFHTLYYGAAPIGAGGAEYHDTATTHGAVDFLTTRTDPAPFYLQVGYINPHDICEFEHSHEINAIPDPVRQGFLKEEDLPPLPSNFRYDPAETMVQSVFRRDDNALIHGPILAQTHRWTDIQWRYLSWMYYRFIERVDLEIGLLLQALEAGGWADNTLVIFTSDHGEAAGRHRMFQKFTLYEESVRVPLTIASFGEDMGLLPGGNTSDTLVSGVDLFATICDYAGMAPPAGTHGRSLKSSAAGRPESERSYIFIENNYWERAVVRKDCKLITEYKPRSGGDFLPPSPSTHQFGRMQLFNLKEDPMERINRADDPAYSALQEECLAILRRHEAGLNRRPLRTGQPEAVVRQARKALLNKWERET